MEQGLDRIEDMVQDLLHLARGGEGMDMEELDLGEVAEEAWENVSAKDGFDGSLRIEDQGITIEADKGQFKRLLENLFRNSLEADPEATIEVGDSRDYFYVEDDGPGINEEDLDRIFEWGYSTGQGTGLGLSIVKEVADLHGWRVRPESDGGFRVEFRL